MNASALRCYRDFAAHPRQGLAALDDLLADHGDGMDADSFFADWVLANHLNDGRREDGRFGYRMLQDKTRRAQSAPSNRIRQLPAGIRAATAPYSADYYELPLPQGSASAERLLIDFRLSAPAPQDAWLQLVQVLADSIEVQRFRASDYRNQPVLASLRGGPERVFIAVAPFTPERRRLTRPVHYSLALRELPSLPNNQAQVTATLNLRSEPEIADNILGRLQRCSYVQVLQRGEQWSQVLVDDGLIGWSHNDYLFHTDAPSPGGRNSCAALLRAAHDGNLAAVQGLLASGANVHVQDAYGRTALHEAAFWGHERVLDRLLRAGADIHTRDNAGISALDEAIQSGDAGSILLLHEAGAGPDLSDPASLPFMIDAAATGNRELLELFLSKGHDVDWRDRDGRTALMAAAENGQNTTLRQLIAAGANPQLTDRNGRSPLMLAAAGGHLGVLGILHKTDADINRQDREGHSALTLAAANGHALSVAWLLLSSSVDVHHTLPASGRNALHLAAAGHADVVAMLMLADIDVHAEDADGHTALQLAGAGGHDRATRYLRMPDPEKARPRGGLTEAEIADFLAAAQSGNLAETDRLLAAATEAGWRGQPLLVTDEEGLTALMLAARAGHRDVALRLLLAGANPDIRENIGWDEPALFFTIRDGYDGLSALLLLAGAHPLAMLNASPNVSALHWAADFGREDVVHLLLNLRDARRISVNARGFSGWTPLFQAVFSGHANIVRILLAAGADPDARARNVPFMGSASSLEYARARGNQTIINLLLKAGAEG